MLLISSDQDLQNISEEDRKAAEKYIDPLFFVQLKGVSHALHIEATKPILRVVNPFLEFIQ